MNYFDLLAFICAPNVHEAAAIWQQCHPGKPKHWITNDPGIKAFWKTRIGQAALWGCRPIWEPRKLLHYYRLLKWRGGKLVRQVNACLVEQEIRVKLIPTLQGFKLVGNRD